MKLSRIFRPYTLFLVSHLLALSVWLIPESYVIRKGYIYTGFDSYGFFVYLIYILFFSFSFFISFHFAAKSGFSIVGGADLRRGLPFFLISFLAILGSFLAFYKASEGLSLVDIFSLILDGKANKLKESLYYDYSVGYLSLRYLSIPAAVLSFIRFTEKKALGAIDIINIISIILTSLMSSRLSVMWFFIAASGLFLSGRSIKINLTKSVIIIIILFFILSLLNYSRNKLYYESIGADNIIEAGLAEFVAYLGTPVHGGMLALKNIFNSHNIQQIISASIENSLTTNSAIAEILSSGDVISLCAWFFILCILSFFLGLFYKSKAFFFRFVYFLALYPFSEFWRINLFDKGITIAIFLTVFLIGLPQYFLKGFRRPKDILQNPVKSQGVPKVRI